MIQYYATYIDGKTHHLLALSSRPSYATQNLGSGIRSVVESWIRMGSSSTPGQCSREPMGELGHFSYRQRQAALLHPLTMWLSTPSTMWSQILETIMDEVCCSRLKPFSQLIYVGPNCRRNIKSQSRLLHTYYSVPRLAVKALVNSLLGPQH